MVNGKVNFLPKNLKKQYPKNKKDEFPSIGCKSRPLSPITVIWSIPFQAFRREKRTFVNEVSWDSTHLDH